MQKQIKSYGSLDVVQCWYALSKIWRYGLKYKFWQKTPPGGPPKLLSWILCHSRGQSDLNCLVFYHLLLSKALHFDPGSLFRAHLSGHLFSSFSWFYMRSSYSHSMITNILTKWPTSRVSSEPGMTVYSRGRRKGVRTLKLSPATCFYIQTEAGKKLKDPQREHCVLSATVTRLEAVEEVEIWSVSGVSAITETILSLLHYAIVLLGGGHRWRPGAQSHTDVSQSKGRDLCASTRVRLSVH